jgi:nucleoside-diphosphate-sugar epimerase
LSRQACSHMALPPLPLEDLEHVLSGARESWEALRGRRIFVTGATGFFGTWLLETFAYANDMLGLGSSLVGLSRDPAAFATKSPHLAAHPAITIWQGDVRNFDFPAGNFSHVIHAGTTSSAPVPPLDMLDTIINGTRRTLDFAVATGAQDFLLVSSGAVYGKQPQEMTHIPETYTGGPDILDPRSAYGEGKRVAELLGAIYHRECGLRLKTARCFAFVGPHLPLDAHFAIGNFIRDALQGGLIRVSGDGTPMRSYLYAADLAVWLWRFLLGPCTGTFNVGSEDAYSVLEVAEAVASALGGGLEVSVAQSAYEGLVSRYVPDCKRARTGLEIASEVDLLAAIRRTAHYHQR